MWIKTENGDAVNMEYAANLEVVEVMATDYEVVVSTPAGNYYTIATFETEDEAKACVDEIISALNGGKVGYSFSWLKKAEKSNDAPEEKPADKKPVDKFVDDGIAW